MRRRILVTGSRDWNDRAVVSEALREEYELALHLTNEVPILVHGHCPTGADAIADAVWLTNTGLLPERHPADWRYGGKRAGFARNEYMVALGANVCLAFLNPCVKHPAQEPHPSHGGDHCSTLADEAGIPVRRFFGGGLA